MKKDCEYRYFMENDKLMRFHIEQEVCWDNPRNEFGGDGYFTKMYLNNREFNCTDDKICEVTSSEEAIRMMISDADIDIVNAVDSGKIPRMEIKYDDEYEGYELWVDGYCEVDEDYYDKAWFEDDIIEYLTIDDLEKASDDLYVIPLQFNNYDGGISAYDSVRSDPDGYIWTTTKDMIKAGFKNMTGENLRKKAYEILNDDIKAENLWATGNVFWYEIEECINVMAHDNETSWIDNDSCGGFIVDGWIAYDEIYNEVVGSTTPYHDNLNGLYSWPEFRISFDDYFEILSNADIDADLDNLSETLAGRIDWSAKSIEAYITEVSNTMEGLKLHLDNIIDEAGNFLDRYSECVYSSFNNLSNDYCKTYEDYIDKWYRLKELKSIEKEQTIYESEVA